MDASATITRPAGELISFPARPGMAPEPAADTKIVEAVRAVFAAEVKPILDTYLADISFRIRQEYELQARLAGKAKGTVFAEDLNLQGKHFLTGYTVTANSPAAGSIAWADLHVVYNGTDYPITNANTNLKYCWWSPTTTPTTMQTSNTKPVLAQGEVLIFMNNGGTPKVMLSDTNQSLPGVIGDGAVDAGSILANAVTTVAIADGAVGSTQLGANAVVSAKIADGAVTRAGQLAANVVTNTQIANDAVRTNSIQSNAVTTSELANGAVSRSAQMGTNVVTATAVADGAVNRSGQLGANVVTGAAVADSAISRAGQLAANVVTSGKVADGAVNRSGILASNVVTSAAVADNALSRAAQLAANVVTNNAIANNAVQANNIVTGAVGATKLDILRHVLY